MSFRVHTRERARVHAYGSDCGSVEHATIFRSPRGRITLHLTGFKGVRCTHFCKYATINVASSYLGC